MEETKIEKDFVVEWEKDIEEEFHCILKSREYKLILFVCVPTSMALVDAWYIYICTQSLQFQMVVQTIEDGINQKHNDS